MGDLREKSDQQIPKVDGADSTLRLRVIVIVVKYGVYSIDLTLVQYNCTSNLVSTRRAIQSNIKDVAYPDDSAEIEMVAKQAHSGVSFKVIYWCEIIYTTNISGQISS